MCDRGRNGAGSGGGAEAPAGLSLEAEVLVRWSRSGEVCVVGLEILVFMSVRGEQLFWCGTARLPSAVDGCNIALYLCSSGGHAFDFSSRPGQRPAIRRPVFVDLFPNYDACVLRLKTVTDSAKILLSLSDGFLMLRLSFLTCGQTFEVSRSLPINETRLSQHPVTFRVTKPLVVVMASRNSFLTS